ncbi:MAG TPA: hypothetical protein VGF34_17095 [Stellaceae bacterium]|jgi:hypothetical protein
MARRQKVQRPSEYTLFDVLYEDGSRTSHRKVPSSELDGRDAERTVKPYIEAEDRKIAALSGKPRAPVKSVSRSPMR